MPADFPVTELWRVISGEAPGRRDAAAITLFDSVGFAIEDFAALRYLRDRLDGREAQLDLVADPDDPRDLVWDAGEGGRQGGGVKKRPRRSGWSTSRSG